MLRKFLSTATIVFLCTACLSAYGQDSRREKSSTRNGSSVGGYTEVTEAGKVPEHLYNVILGRPTNESIVASVVAFEEMDAYLEFGTAQDSYSSKTPKKRIQSAEPAEFVMDDLQANTQYYYQLRYKQTDQATFEASEQYAFHTPRSPDSNFIFTVQADSHLDENTSSIIYSNSLKGALDVSPDFHLALGDTFLTGKYVDHVLAEPHYLAQRYYFGTFLTHSAPLFFALGNHDAEAGGTERQKWATNIRNKYFPNPSPNEFYTGNTDSNPDGSPIRNYYAFEWGNSLFIALDPFRYTEGRGGKGDDNWYMTLGRTQYDWLVSTLSNSDATFKFVYLHNLVGGFQSNRGGVEASFLFEWGGHEYDGRYTFDEMRPGWGKPIHDVLVENDVSILFHGHDHMYIHQERDGLTYQLVPQPGHRNGSGGNAKAYGYLSGNLVRGSGNIQVFVSDNQVKVNFVDSRINTNGELLHSYVINRAED